jgi:hypothetical protein
LWLDEGLFPEFLKIFENDGATGLGRSRVAWVVAIGLT